MLIADCCSCPIACCCKTKIRLETEKVLVSSMQTTGDSSNLLENKATARRFLVVHGIPPYRFVTNFMLVHANNL